jgi:hypothetical protein
MDYAGISRITFTQKLLELYNIYYMPTSWEGAQKLFERGYQMLMLMADGTSLAKLAAKNVAHFKEHYPSE